MRQNTVKLLKAKYNQAIYNSSCVYKKADVEKIIF